MLYYFALLLPCFTCLAWASLLIRKWRVNNDAQNIVAINLLILAFCALGFADLLLQTNNYTWQYIEDAIHMSILTMVFPLFVRYFRLLTNDAKLKWWNNIIFLPTVLVSVAMIVTHTAMGDELSVSYVRDFLYSADSLPNTTNEWLNLRINLLTWICVILCIQELYLIVYALISLRTYRRELNNFYSNNEDKSIGVNYLMLISLMIYFILMAVSIIVSVDFIREQLTLTISLMVVYSVILSTLAGCANQAKYTAADMARLAKQIDTEVSKIELNTQNDSKRRGYPSSLQPKFNKLIDDKKVFLQPNLSIDEICRQLDTNRHYICRMISDVYGMSFFDYINSRRIEYAKALLSAQPDISEEEVAKRTGFLHINAFRQIFKQLTEQTPSHWRENNAAKTINSNHNDRPTDPK